jgi:hypothetical protein
LISTFLLCFASFESVKYMLIFFIMFRGRHVLGTPRPLYCLFQLTKYKFFIKQYFCLIYYHSDVSWYPSIVSWRCST